MNKYEYGVEYETNGVKPDLPDDVMVHAFDFVLMQNYHREVEDINWSHVNKFRVIDVRTVEPFKPEVDDSSWHERGELPPVGEVVLGHVQDSAGQWKWLEVEILKHNNISKNECAVHVTKHAILRWCDQFKPLPTERDKLVNECVKILGDGQLSGDIKSLRDQAELLVSKNWRPIKQQTSAEFCREAWNKGGVIISEADSLYRAGCRFIERGDL